MHNLKSCETEHMGQTFIRLEETGEVGKECRVDRENLLLPLPSFSGPGRDGRGGGRRRATDGPGAALGIAAIGGGQRASEWPPFAFYTAKIHLISRWWTEGAQRAAAKSMCSCNASQSVRPPPTEWPCPRPERSQMGGRNATLGRLLLLRRQRRVPRVQEREYVTAALTLVAI